MTDPQALVHALTAIRTATEIVKGLRAAEASFQKAELKLQIADLAEALAEARLNIVEVQEEILTLRRRVTDLEQEKATRESLDFRKDAYWRTLDSGKEDGPYCARCFEADGKAIHMQDLRNGFHYCTVCKTTIGQSNEAPPDSRYVINDGGY